MFGSFGSFGSFGLRVGHRGVLEEGHRWGEGFEKGTRSREWMNGQLTPRKGRREKDEVKGSGRQVADGFGVDLFREVSPKPGRMLPQII